MDKDSFGVSFLENNKIPTSQNHVQTFLRPTTICLGAHIDSSRPWRRRIILVNNVACGEGKEDREIFSTM